MPTPFISVVNGESDAGIPLRIRLGVLREVLVVRELQPLAVEVADGRPRALVGEQAARVRLDALDVVELARLRGIQQLVVGRRAPQQMGEPRRDLVARQRDDEVALAARRQLDLPREVRRLQHALDDEAHPLDERRAAVVPAVGTLVERDPARALDLGERPPVHAAAEFGDELLRAREIAVGGRARQQLGPRGAAPTPRGWARKRK